MSAKFDTTAIEQEKKALQLLVDEVQKATDDDQREMLTKEIQKSAERLQEMCAALQVEADKIKPAPDDGIHIDAVVEVVLTGEQRQRVLEATGIDVPSVRISDPTGELTKSMPEIEPNFIEECAIEQAEAFKRLAADAEDASAVEILEQ